MLVVVAHGFADGFVVAIMKNLMANGHTRKVLCIP